jgi:two-component system, cell cycle response regulator DivK
MAKLLVVEDNTDTRDLLHHYFTNAGFSVVTGIHGGEGIYMAKAEKPDLILTDISMPTMDGIDMIRQIRAEAETADIPILVFTAYGSSTTEEAIDAGATQAFYKPFDFDELTKVVRSMVDEANDR